MNTYKLAGTHYMAFETHNSFPSNFGLGKNDLPSCQTSLVVHELTFQPNQFSYGGSTSEEAEEQHQKLIDERKQRRMISNRESARRSRMRKKRQIHELWSQVLWLRMENHDLLEKLNHVSESHDQILQENIQLKEEASNLRHMFISLQLDTDVIHNALKDLETIPCITASS